MQRRGGSTGGGTAMATPNESSISDSISFLQQYLNSTHGPTEPMVARREAKEEHGLPLHRMMGSGGPREGRRDTASPFVRSMNASTAGGPVYADTALRHPTYRPLSAGSNSSLPVTRSASAGSTASWQPRADWRSRLPSGAAPVSSASPPCRRASSLSEGLGRPSPTSTPPWQRRQQRGHSYSGQEPAAAGSSVPSAYPDRLSNRREGSLVPKIIPSPFVHAASRFRNTSFHDDQYQRPHRGTSGGGGGGGGGGGIRAVDSPLRAPSAYSASWRRPSPERRPRDPADYEPVPVGLPTDTHPTTPRETSAEERGRQPILSPPRRSAPQPPLPPPPPPQIPLQEPRSVPAFPPHTGAADPPVHEGGMRGTAHGETRDQSYLNTTFPPSTENHPENLRALSLYLKHYYAREVEEDRRGLETLLPEDILGLAQCFYVDLYRLVREERRQAGLSVKMFSAGDPQVGAVGESPDARSAGTAPSPAPTATNTTPQRGSSRSSGKATPVVGAGSSERRRWQQQQRDRELSAAATVTYRGNDEEADEETSDRGRGRAGERWRHRSRSGGRDGSAARLEEEEEEEGVSLRAGEKKVIQAVAKEIIKSLASSPPERAQAAQGSRHHSHPHQRALQSPRRDDKTGSDASDDSDIPAANSTEDYEASLPSQPWSTVQQPLAHVTHLGPSAADPPVAPHVQRVEARVPVFVQPMHGNYTTSVPHPQASALSHLPATMETQVYQDSSGHHSTVGGARQRSSPMRQQQQQQQQSAAVARLLAGVPNSPYGTRKILAGVDPNSGAYTDEGIHGATTGGGGGGGGLDESTLAFLQGTPSRTPERRRPQAQLQGSGARSLRKGTTAQTPSPGRRARVTPPPGRSPRGNAAAASTHSHRLPVTGQLSPSASPPAAAMTRRGASPAPPQQRSPSRGGGGAAGHSGILKRPLKNLMPLLRHGAGLVKFISSKRRPHLRFFVVQDCLDTFKGREVLMPHLTWRAIPSDTSAEEMRVRVTMANVSSSATTAEFPDTAGRRRPSFLGEFEAALNLVDLQGVHVGTSSAPQLFRRGKPKKKPFSYSNVEDGFASTHTLTPAEPPVLDHEGNPLGENMCAVLVFKTRMLGLGFLTEEERQIWLGAFMGVVERNKTLNV